MTGTCSGRVLNKKTSAFFNSNFEIRDSTLKLDMIGINFSVNLNLNFRSKFKLTQSFLCRLDGSCGPVAAEPQLRLPVSNGKYGPGRLSDGKGQAASRLKPAAALRPLARLPPVVARLEIPPGQVQVD